MVEHFNIIIEKNVKFNVYNFFMLGLTFPENFDTSSVFLKELTIVIFSEKCFFQ